MSENTWDEEDLGEEIPGEEEGIPTEPEIIEPESSQEPSGGEMGTTSTEPDPETEPEAPNDPESGDEGDDPEEEENEPEETEIIPPSFDLEQTTIEELDGALVLSVKAIGEDLYSLEIDHSLEGLLPEFTIYAMEGNAFDEDSRELAESLGVEATYQDGLWTLVLLKDGLARQTVAENNAGKVSFYLVVSDQSGESSGNMYDGSYHRVDFIPEEVEEPEEPGEPETEYPFADLSTEELVELIKEDATGRDAVLLREATTEYARRTVVEPAWSPKQIREYLLYETIPAQTESGVWVNDVTRHDRAARQWSDEELVAWLEEEIQVSRAATATQLKLEFVRRFGLRPQDNTTEGLKRAYQRKLLNDTILTTDSEPFAPVTLTVDGRVESFVTEELEFTGLSDATRTYIVESIQRYLDVVRPGALVGETEGGRAQQELERTFRYVLNLKGQELLTGLNVIMAAVRKHRNDIFSASAAYRFTHLLKGGLKTQQQHINFIELFRVYSDPNTDIRNQVDVRSMVASYPEPVANVLVDYFRNYS